MAKAVVPHNGVLTMLTLYVIWWHENRHHPPPLGDKFDFHGPAQAVHEARASPQTSRNASPLAAATVAEWECGEDAPGQRGVGWRQGGARLARASADMPTAPKLRRCSSTNARRRRFNGHAPREILARRQERVSRRCR